MSDIDKLIDKIHNGCDDVKCAIDTRHHHCARELINSYTDKKESEAYDEGYKAGKNAELPTLLEAVEFRREQYGWNQTKMAAMLDLSRSHYTEFKHGRRGLPVKSIRKAYAIGVPAAVLLQEELK